MTSVVIDPNVRIGGGTYSGFEDIRGPMPRVGDVVTAVEIESGMIAPATVTALNDKAALIFLALSWRTLGQAS